MGEQAIVVQMIYYKLATNVGVRLLGMDQSTSNASVDDGLSQASHALASFFDGIVFVEEADGTLRQVETVQASEGTGLNLSEFSLPASDAIEEPEVSHSIEALLPEQLNLLQAQGVQPLISLSQLRQWYATTRSLGRFDRLARIAELGRLFKQMFGEVNPNQLHAFTGWSMEEVEWWLEDMAGSQQSQSQIYRRSKPHSTNIVSEPSGCVSALNPLGN